MADMLPPAYEEEDGDKPSDMIEPLLLSFTNKVIARLPQTLQDDEPLEMYTLSWDFLHNPRYGRDVDLQRVVRTLKTTSAGDPKVRLRERLAYAIRCLSEPTVAAELSTIVNTPRAWVSKASRSAMGSFGLKPASLWRKKGAFKAVKLMKGTPKAVGQVGLEQPPVFDKGEKKPLFEISKDGVWTDADGQVLARAEDGEGSEKRLITNVHMRRDVLDALVALWCCRIWAAEAIEKR